jgi:O-antigen/teichoic acid export membrane protein
VPIGVNTLLFTVLLKLDQALIGLLAADGTVQVGIYAAAMRLVEATMFIPWAFLAAMLPWLSRQETGARALTRGYELGLKVLMVILLPIGLGFLLLADPIIELLYGAEFSAAVLPLQLLGLTVVLYGMNAFAAVVMVAQDRPARFTVVLVGVTAMNIALNLVLVPTYGADGAAVAALASAVVLAVVSLLQVRLVVGAIRVVRTFAGPLLAGLVMAGIALAVPGPAVVGVVLGIVGFAVALFAFERVSSPEDVAAGMQLLRRRPVEGAV